MVGKKTPQATFFARFPADTYFCCLKTASNYSATNIVIIESLNHFSVLAVQKYYGLVFGFTKHERYFCGDSFFFIICLKAQNNLYVMRASFLLFLIAYLNSLNFMELMLKV